MVNVTLSFPEKLLKKIDEYCEKYGVMRSEFIRESVRLKLEGKSDFMKLLLEGKIDEKWLDPIILSEPLAKAGERIAEAIGRGLKKGLEKQKGGEK